MKEKTSSQKITKLKENEVFVFGSNKEGNHAGGAAKLAADKFGAINGHGEGIQGQSYAIPTMDGLEETFKAVNRFIIYAKANADKLFLVTEIGCGIAGFKPEQIAPFFAGAIFLDNVHLPESFCKALSTGPVLGFKGFDKDFKCREKQYAVGQTFTEEDAIPCQKGIHYCEYPLDIFSYYNPADSRFAQVIGSEKIARHSEDSKVATTKLEVTAEINIAALVKASVKYIYDRVDWTGKKDSNTGDRSAATNTGYRSAATNTGYQSAATNTGYQSAATNTGDQSAATNTGYQSAATNTGYRSAATNTGYQSAATNTGYQSAATNTGDRSAATNTGDRSAATNTGYRSAATNTGYQSAATNTGDRSAATNTGYQSAATNTGDQSAATVEGKESVAISLGIEGKAKGKVGCFIVLADWKEIYGEWHRVNVLSLPVDGEKIKADTFYTVKNSVVVECE